MDEQLKQIQKLLDAAEANLTSARSMVRELTDAGSIEPLNMDEKLDGLNAPDEGKVIEGIFDGEAMVAPDGQTYPVPPNYASKSKLVEGDTLKLTITDDGSFVFKQIAPVERRNAIGTLVYADGSYTINSEGKSYKVLTASVTFYRAEPGDQITILLPKDHDTNWAVFENVIKKASQEVAEPSVETETNIPEPPIATEEPTVEPSFNDRERVIPVPVPEVAVSEATKATEPLLSDILADVDPAPAMPISITDTPAIEVPSSEITDLPREPAVSESIPAIPEPEIEFPAGGEPLSDEQLLQNLKENLKSLEQPSYTAPGATPAIPKPVDNIVATEMDRLGSQQGNDKQIAELDI